MASEISRIETGGVSRPIKDETARNDNLILHQQDNRIYKGKNFARTYPYYPDATYRIDVKEAFDEKTVELILRLINDKSVKLYGSNNSGNYMIPISRVIEIIQEA